MVKHIVLWDFKEEIDNTARYEGIREFENQLLKAKEFCAGCQALSISYPLLGSSNADVILDSSFNDEEALEFYQIHPEHIKAKDIAQRLFVNRRAADYIE